jgi:hypothetical protein
MKSSWLVAALVLLLTLSVLLASCEDDDCDGDDDGSSDDDDDADQYPDGWNTILEEGFEDGAWTDQWTLVGDFGQFFEQTTEISRGGWSSIVYQAAPVGDPGPGILLATPIDLRPFEVGYVSAWVKLDPGEGQIPIVRIATAYDDVWMTADFNVPAHVWTQVYVDLVGYVSWVENFTFGIYLVGPGGETKELGSPAFAVDDVELIAATSPQENSPVGDDDDDDDDDDTTSDDDDDNDDDDTAGDKPVISDASWDPNPVAQDPTTGDWLSSLVFFVCDANDDLSGGQIYTYLAGTTDPFLNGDVYWDDFAGGAPSAPDCGNPEPIQIWINFTGAVPMGMDICTDFEVTDGAGNFSNMLTDICVYIP